MDTPNRYCRLISVSILQRFPNTNLLLTLFSRLVSRVSREEIELMAEEIEATEASHNTAQLLASQALLAIR